MPSRSIKNRTRGNQKGALPAKPKPRHGDLVSSYDGRANTSAGKYERRADGDAEQSDKILEWRK